MTRPDSITFPEELLVSIFREAGRLARETADACIQFHGGMGYMEETWTARNFRDSRLTSIGGGADAVMLRVLTKLGRLRAVTR